MKKILAMMLTAAMMLSMGTAVWADETPREEYEGKLNVDASFNKIYDVINETNSSKTPAEVFTFNFTAIDVKEQEAGITLADAPVIDPVTTTFAALTETTTNPVTVNLEAADFPGIGVYTYRVDEVIGDTAGVTYRTTPLYLVVTILRDTDDNIKFVAAVHYSEAKDSSDKTGDVTNEYRASELEVTKNVTGNMGDKNKDFEVTVTFTKPDGLFVRSEITYESNAAATVTDADGNEISNPDKENGTISWPITESTGAESGEKTYVQETTVTKTILLKHNETVTFANIPYGVTYTVAESDYTTAEKGGYDEAVYAGSDVVNGAAVENGEMTDPTETVTITNNKGTTVDTGISVDSIPYIAMLGVVALGGTGLVISKKRRSED